MTTTAAKDKTAIAQNGATIKNSNVSAKTVGVTLNFGDAYRYEYTVKIPTETIEHEDVLALLATNAQGKESKLGDLGIATMWLLYHLGHARAFEKGQYHRGYGWKLVPRSIRRKWRADYVKSRIVVQLPRPAEGAESIFEWKKSDASSRD
jgi:hypothetical protein